MSAILPYLSIRGQDDPLFRLQDVQYLLIQKLHVGLISVIFDGSSNSDHSFRIGVITTAIAKKVGDTTVQMLGCWASDSFKCYVQIPRFK